MRVCVSVFALVLLASCAGEETPAKEVSKSAKDAAPTAAAKPAPKKEIPQVDAGTSAPSIDSTEYHLDGDQVRYKARSVSRSSSADSIELLLRSTPPDAVASVNGDIVGKTPILWRGSRTGKEHEFTFVLPGYSVARYRFVPVRSGIVHGSLKRVQGKRVDAGPEQPSE